MTSTDIITDLSTLGEQSRALDARISKHIIETDRVGIWNSVNRIFNSYQSGNSTVLALGYVQSGKTTSITALCAGAADRGFQVIVAILGSTLLLRDQNRTRVEDYLGLDEHNYRWVSFTDLSPKRTPKEISNWLGRDRVILVPILKNARVINKVSEILEKLNLEQYRCLVIDDEADQASLNTNANTVGESSTYSAIINLRTKLPKHLYVQYTATPYAPLLLKPTDPLMPSDVEFLMPGHGYTGGREFFIQHAEKVIRDIPSGDEQNSKTPISELPDSLEIALASFLVGTVHLYLSDKTSAPISMLIHSTFKNDLQERYHFLIDRFLQKYRQTSDISKADFAVLVGRERQRLYQLGIAAIDDSTFWTTMEFVLGETTLWLVNSATEIKKVQWNLAPFHILIGGNKLDRGFTVEGLTVTYMNRPASEQIDTIEQRARAFGYRTGLLPYCQFFASARTIKTLRGIVHTEDDLRANLRDFLESGRTVAEWAKQIGLFLPPDTKPTRDAVVPALSSFNGDWYSIRKPLLEAPARDVNRDLLQNVGLFSSKSRSYQRMSFKTMDLPLCDVIEQLLEPWKVNPTSPGWNHEEILEFLRRRPRQDSHVPIILMDNPDRPNNPRVRKWVDDTGFVNLFQGKDLTATKPGFDYKGDRSAGLEDSDEDKVVLQVHHVSRRGVEEDDLFTLAVHLGSGKWVRRGSR
jgi:hypothetical protein